jgi:hypothetical protein
MAIKFSFLKIPQHKRFEYKPRIWDPEKEEREERLKRIMAESGVTNDTSDGKPYVPNIRGSFRREYERTRKARPGIGFGAFKIRSIVFVVTVAMLLLIGYYTLRMFPYLFSRSVNPPATEIYE